MIIIFSPYQICHRSNLQKNSKIVLMGKSSRFFVSMRISTSLKIFFKEAANNDALQIYAKLWVKW